ncbi:hypothetical protein [Paenibacillus sp. J22TS3]|uniref:hypothetical protein n=1 Tax=Paenibacillus sp. J22TS3 TaxID=2807192 RepID=UPI001B020235|nr:hypothetical protein [Paenibacillus sp. J22TS3]GIP22525.1 hypothetical protein J22TS3_28000 [Paenibacillus sp. J22TS3]
MIAKYRNVENYFKGEFKLGFWSRKVTLKKLHYVKEELRKIDISELRTLKSDANSLAEWFKSINYMFTILIFMCTVFTGAWTSLNQNLLNISNSLTDVIAEERLKALQSAENLDPFIKEEQTITMLNKVTERKQKNARDVYFDFYIFMIVIMIGLFIFASLVLFSSRKYFTISFLLNEVLEEKKELTGEKNSLKELREKRLELKYKTRI